MADNVERKDFMDGVPSTYTGERGHTFEACTVMHQMVFNKVEHHETVKGLPVEDKFDLVVVGAGLSGLCAAYFYKQRFGADKKILILDPLEDFGGHAKRNDFLVDGQHLIGYGGSETLQSPENNFSESAKGLLKSLGIDVTKFQKSYFHHNLYPGLGLSRASFFDKGRFGADKLVKGDPTDWVSDDIPKDKKNDLPLKDFIDQFPMSADSRKQLHELFTSKRVTLAHLPTVDARVEYLSKISYEAFIKKDWGVSDEVAAYFHNRTVDFFGTTAANIAAITAGPFGYPGLQGVEGLPEDEEAKADMDEPYIYHFPDGNASVARMLVRSLIPACAPGNTMEDIVLAKFDYSKLDAAGSAVRLRLNSSACYVANNGDIVDVGYIQNKTTHHVQTKHCVVACFNVVAGRIVHGLDEPKKKALNSNVKAPLVFANVALKNWHSWVKLGVHDIFGVSSFWTRAKLDFPVSMGGYECPKDPSKPIIIHMVHVPSVDTTTDPVVGLRAARKTLFANKFNVFEENIRKDLNNMLGPGGFKESDIAAITVNRWSHGYSWTHNSMVHTEDQMKEMIKDARKPLGNITFAGSDSGWAAYAQSAIDEAHRSVQEFKA